MSPETYRFVSLDMPAMLTATLAALACGLLGNFLVLRRLSLMGDAISHAVLPGLVVAFLLSGSRATLAMFVGAAVTGVLTAVLVEAVRKLARLETGAAMGVVFSVLFAGGVLLLEQAAARNVDLDPDCVLHGQLERVFWFPPDQWSRLIDVSALSLLPRELLTLAGISAAAAVFILVFYKELKITAFDPALATALGFNANLMHYLYMVIVAGAVVASFEAVGSILVIAMLICPAATARLLTDRLGSQIVLSALLAVLTGVGGYVVGAFAPPWFGWNNSINVAGTMATLAGLLLMGAAIGSPSHGVVARWLRQLRLAVEVAREDLLGLLYRVEELHGAGHVPHWQASLLATRAVEVVLGGRWVSKLAIRQARQAGEIRDAGEGLALSEAGKQRARSLVRSHRLWETFLVRELGLRSDHVHGAATRLEHLRTPEISRGLAEVQPPPALDPHARRIPEEDGGP